jgi:hypothetical protein
MGVLQTICLGWPWPTVLQISASQVARMTGVSHWHPAPSYPCILTYSMRVAEFILQLLFLTNFKDTLSWSIWAAINKCHRLGDLYSIQVYFSQFYRLEGPRSRCGHIWWPRCPRPQVVVGTRQFCGISFIRTLIPPLMAQPDDLMTFPSHPLPQINTLVRTCDLRPPLTQTCVLKFSWNCIFNRYNI